MLSTQSTSPSHIGPFPLDVFKLILNHCDRVRDWKILQVSKDVKKIGTESLDRSRVLIPAIKANNLSILRIMIKNLRNSSKENYKLLSATLKGTDDKKKIRKLLKQMPRDPLLLNEALCLASRQGHVMIVKKLKALCLKEFVVEAIALASLYNHPAIVKSLIKDLAIPAGQEQAQHPLRKAMNIAVCEGHLKVAKKLLKSYESFPSLIEQQIRLAIFAGNAEWLALLLQSLCAEITNQNLKMINDFLETAKTTENKKIISLLTTLRNSLKGKLMIRGLKRQLS